MIVHTEEGMRKYSKCKIQKVAVGNFYPFLSLFLFVFAGTRTWENCLTDVFWI